MGRDIVLMAYYNISLLTKEVNEFRSFIEYFRCSKFRYFIHNGIHFEDIL